MQTNRKYRIFKNLSYIPRKPHKNISSLMTNTNNYVTSVSNYNQKYYRIRRGSRIPSEHTKLKDKRFVMNAFNKMKNTNDRDFQVLLQMIKLSERQENSKNMELYKQIMSAQKWGLFLNNTDTTPYPMLSVPITNDVIDKYLYTSILLTLSNAVV